MKKAGKLKGKTICTFGVKLLFLFCIAFVAFEAYAYRADGSVDVLPLLCVMIGTIGILVLTKYLAKRFLKGLQARFSVFLAVYLLVLFVIQLIFGECMRYTPMWDLGAVFDGAISWVEQGNIDSNAEYFYYFPNNLGLTVVFKCYFTLVRAVFGTGVDYFTAAMVLGSILVTVFRFCVIWISKKLFGTEYAATMMVLLLLCIPLYFASAVFYTDIMSMAAPALFYLLYLYARESDSIKKCMLWYSAMALVAAIGMEIKFTVVIIVIAVVMEMLLRGEWKRCILMAGIQFVLIGAVFGAVNHVVYSKLLEKEQAEIQNTPYLHWGMMGAQGNGSYNAEDYEFTRSFTDREQQREALWAEIKERYEALGVQGTLDLWKRKTIKCFGDGTYALSDFLDDEPANDTKWHQWLLYSGEKYISYQTLCLGVFVTIMLMMLFGVVGSLSGECVLSADMTALWLAFLGVWIFLMFWETSARYFTNHLSVMLVAALYGLPHFENWVRSWRVR